MTLRLGAEPFNFKKVLVFWGGFGGVLFGWYYEILLLVSVIR